MTVRSPANTSGAFPNYTGTGAPNGVQPGTVGQLYVQTSTNPQTLWWKQSGSGTTGWVAIGTPGAGGINSVVAGTDIGVDDTDPNNPVVSFTGDAPIGEVLSLTYDASDPFDVVCLGVPAGYTPGAGIVSLMAQIVVGDGVGIPSGALEDINSDAIPDGFTFPAVIFLEDSVIYDILAFNAYQFTPNGGLLWWGPAGGPPIPVPFSSGIDTSVLTVTGSVVMSGLPTSDPTSAGELWNNLGILTVSAG